MLILHVIVGELLKASKIAGMRIVTGCYPAIVGDDWCLTTTKQANQQSTANESFAALSTTLPVNSDVQCGPQQI